MRTEAIQRYLGGRIRALRLQSGWSQEQLAEIRGLHRTFMGHVERGEKNSSLSTMVRISDALNVPLSELLLIDGESLRLPRARHAGGAPRRGDSQALQSSSTSFRELRIERNALQQAMLDLVQVSKRLNGRTRK